MSGGRRPEGFDGDLGWRTNAGLGYFDGVDLRGIEHGASRLCDAGGSRGDFVNAQGDDGGFRGFDGAVVGFP